MKPVQQFAQGGDEAVGTLPLRAKQGRSVTGKSLRDALAASTVAWMFGNVWYVTVSGAAFTLFARALGASPLEVGILSAVPYLAALVSLPASLLIERTGARRRIFFWGLYFQRGLWVALGLVPVWIVGRYGMAAAPVALGVFIPMYFLAHAGNAVGGPAWVSWMADVVPGRARGKYFARRRMWSMISAIPAAWFVGWLLDHYLPAHDDAVATMRWCAVLFVGAAVFGLADVALFHAVPDVPQAPRRGAGLVRAMAGPLRDKQYLWFAGFVATLFFAVLPIQQQFYAFYLVDQIGLKNKSVQLMMLVVPSVAQLVLLPVWGRAVDRMGKKPVLALATLGLVPAGLGWCFVHAGNPWLGFALSAVGMGLWSGVDLVNFNFVIGMSGSRRNGAGGTAGGGTAYHAVNSVIVNAAACAGGLVWGLVAQGLKDWQWTPGAVGGKTFTSFDVLFVLSGVLRLAAVVVFLPRIHEPAARPAGEALRFMGANLVGNLADVVRRPLRLVRGRDEGPRRRAA